jgi:hypothetical protein
MPEYEAKRYEGQIRRGGILMSVHCDNPDWVKRAKDILKETGGEDIASAGEASADFATSDKPMPRRATRPEFRRNGAGGWTTIARRNSSATHRPDRGP